MKACCLPERYAFQTYAGWESAGNVQIDGIEVPAGSARRITHIQAAHVSAGTATFRVVANSGAEEVTVLYAVGCPTIVPSVALTDIWQTAGDFMRIYATVTAGTGTLYFRLWGELWEI